MNNDSPDKNSTPKKDNIVPFTKPEKPAEKKGTFSARQEKSISPPAINLPPFTKYALGVLIVIHLIVTYALSSEASFQAYVNFGFIPGRFSGALAFETLTLLTPITHMFLHAGWIHLGMNGLMLAAFGTGVERWLGGKKLLFIFFVSGLVGILLQFILNPSAGDPVIGASGGLSGLFAAAMIMITKMNTGPNQPNLKLMIIVVIISYLIFGLIGSPDGSSVAWAAHIGGFLGGFAALKILKIL